MELHKTTAERSKQTGATWTADEISARLYGAAVTARRLPPDRSQGYVNSWPTILRSPWEVLAADDRLLRRVPPSPKDVEQMLEVMRWVQWLEVEQRHLVWMRANRYGWRDVCTRFACDRTTAWRRWKAALSLIALHLNGVPKLTGGG